MKYLAKIVLSILLVPTLVVSAQDAVVFHQVTGSTYLTPWYSASWLNAPYTNFRLLGKPTTEHWTMNAIGSERWLVREVKVGDQTFWTALQRFPA